ncbi:MAG: carbohydrate kinase family protein [Methanosphaera sp.]|uniref:carbohydrate kinase family protein n=1 Tax=Methanosphaera sp. TaxID=2666342 RepID=UPI0025D8AFB3|nr:carbohydrate kinase family protein [Methanosphaera sp.]MCI5867688.1 carbohydrate kinase family protein [Methanosphaera sp.]MDD6534156.1 carbohydrate kinase family protein [Methanosphaera sp.]MDY3956035.1 carbohydrate kinase family protein [Methanosphaera sp.]
MNFDIIGFGALNVDRLCHVDDFAPVDGETFINYETKVCGGSAANTIVSIAKLGLKCGHIGKVGSDSYADMMCEYLKENNVDTNHTILTPNGETGEVMGFVDANGDRKLYVTPKVNDDITYDEIKPEYLDTKIIHLTSFVGLNNSASIDTQLEVLKNLDSDVKVSFDPGMLYIQRGSEFINKFLKYTDILLINETELKMLTQKDTLDSAVDAISSEVEILVVKRSTDGSFIKKGDEEYNIGIFNVDAIDTTGAGDAYNAGFLYGLLSGYNLHDSGIIGSYIAAKSTTKSGATSAIEYIDPENIKEIIENY